jgi:photosystem II stability/assembly factor-like uncharacterized protein
MNPSDNKVSLEIPLNTQMKIFAFLFREDYNMPQLFSGVREVGYYGESQPFSIGTQTNNLSLGIALIQVQGTGTETGGETGTTDTTAPTVSSVYPADNQNEVSITENISVTFSKAMNTTSVTTNVSNTICSGSFQLSFNNFSSCIQMSSSPSSSNSYKTFTIDPSDNLSNYTNYKIRVTTGVKDTGGNTLSSQYETLIGFTTSLDNSSNSSDNSSSSGSGVFLGVGNSGKIVRSTDNGLTFSAVTSVDSTALRGIAFGNNTFVGVGQSGKILRSTDNGLTFSAVTSVDSTQLNGVAFGNNTFVAVGSSGKIIRSTDNGSSWDNVTSVDSTRLKEIAFGNNTFVGVGASGRIVRSTDNGSSFTAVTPVNSNINQYPYYHHYGVTFGNNTFVVVGASESGSDPTDPGSIARSTDNGSTFSAVTPRPSKYVYGVAFGNNTFVGIGSYGRIVRSTDNGSSFTAVTPVDSGMYYGVTFGNNTFLGVGNSGKILRSTDNGLTFSAVTSVDSTALTKVGFTTPPVLPVGFCYSDPNNSQWYLAKTADEPGWSSGDSCYTPSGSVTPYGGQSCIGGSGLTSCISACQTAGINCNSQ